MRRVAWIVVAFACASSAFAGRVIVEFQGVPSARGGAKAAAAARDLFARFHSDLARIARGAAILSVGHSSHATIRREYSVTFVGAAVDATPDVVDAVSHLPYVRRVYHDTLVHTLATPALSDTVVV